ncbi:MAG: hypothetical protein K6F96_07945 [Bacteroidales bacterium]|nr:hypothetical protein [Bacteroidales bacterium]
MKNTTKSGKSFCFGAAWSRVAGPVLTFKPLFCGLPKNDLRPFLKVIEQQITKARPLLKSGLILFGHPFLKTKNVSRNPSFHEGYG